MTVNEQCKAILQQKCPYTAPVFQYVNGHSFCPCIMQALKAAYIGGYLHGKTNVEPEVGKIEENPNAS